MITMPVKSRPSSHETRMEETPNGEGIGKTKSKSTDLLSACDPRRGDISMAWSREFNQFKSILGVNTKVRGAAGAAGAQGLNMCKVLICDRIQLQDSYSE